MDDNLTRIQFWLVWHEDSGQPPRYRHHSKQAALNEAMRLAKVAPGEVFYVLEATAGVRTKEPDLEHVKFEPYTIPF